MQYTFKELDALSKPYNHKIVYDGYEYWWHSFLNNGWRLHCVKSFSNHKKVIEHIQYWIHKYSLMVSIDNSELERITNEVIDQVRIYDIVNSGMKTIDKVNLIYTIKPFATQVEVSQLLNISKMAISKHLKKIRK
jgi:hypothetical protein